MLGFSIRTIILDLFVRVSAEAVLDVATHIIIWGLLFGASFWGGHH